MKHRELKIPIPLAKHILREKKHPQMRVWLACKGIYGAYAHKNEFDAGKVGELCGISSKSVHYHLRKLLEWNWVGSNATTYFFRPVKYLCEQYGVKGGKSYIVDIEKELG